MESPSFSFLQCSGLSRTASTDRRLRPGPPISVGGVKKRLPTPLIHFDTSTPRLIESLKPAKAPGRTAPAPLRGKSQLGRQGAKSSNDPRFCITGLVVTAVVVLAECELEHLRRARQRVPAGFKQQVDVILHEHIGIIDMTQGLCFNFNVRGCEQAYGPD